MDPYNDMTRRVSKEKNVLVIDLAVKMPKSSLFFYYFIHYSNEGLKKVAKIIYVDLPGWLKERYPEYPKW